jgi:hypothetical protein
VKLLLPAPGVRATDELPQSISAAILQRHIHDGCSVHPLVLGRQADLPAAFLPTKSPCSETERHPQPSIPHAPSGKPRSHHWDRGLQLQRACPV